MKGDFSRLQFRSGKNYTAVLQQQGRVALDADANEQAAIEDYLRTTETIDVVGRSAGPVEDAGFEISVRDGAIEIGPGRYYVEGLLCANDHHVSYQDQQFLVETSPTDQELLHWLEKDSVGAVQVDLQVWRRFVTALDDPFLREPALGQADTTARLQTVWRVVASAHTSPVTGTVSVISGLAAVAGTGTSFTTDLKVGQRVLFASDPTQTPYSISAIASDTGVSVEPPYSGPTATTTTSLIVAAKNCCQCERVAPQKVHKGKMTAWTSGASSDCSCEPTPPAGYRGLENQLYRVEIHQPGDESTATFKWSRENGSVLTAITSISGNQVMVDSLGPDANLGFNVNDWVEITDDTFEFGQSPNQPGDLYSIQSITGLCLTMNLSVDADPTRNARMRRWDQSGSSASSTGIGVSTAAIPVENGIEIQFSKGQFNSGDYWLIPARTATGEIEWPPSENDGDVFLYPREIEVYRAPLASIRWNSGARKPVVTDCRTTFSPLADVDLAFHNKHLHGWGIVCGLQVNCGSDRSRVTVKKGYAIDCDGHDVRIGCDIPVNLVSMAQSMSLLDDAGDGTVSMVLKSNGTVAVEQNDPSQETLGSYFQNTFWVDFWSKCIQPIITFVTTQFSTKSDSSNLPVGPGQQRLDTFLNLLDQLINPVSGQYLFVSPEEDTILRNFYAGFKKVLTSKTFCGLFDSARPFPQYPFASLNIHSAFGSGTHARIRINPSATCAYTMSSDNYVHLYDLANNVMAAKSQFPSYTGAIVKDVALSTDGTQLFAIAQLGANTVAATAAVSGTTLTWNANSVTTIDNVQLVTLAVNGGTVYAADDGQEQGSGLYSAQAGSTLSFALAYSYKGYSLFGHLVIAPVNGIAFAYMTASNTGASGSFNCVLAQDLANEDSSQVVYNLNYEQQQFSGTAGDDMTVAVDPAGSFNNLYVVVDPTANYTDKQLLVFNVGQFDVAGQYGQVNANSIVDLGESNTAICLAFNPTTLSLLAGYADNNWIGVIDPTNHNALNNDLFPTEWSPQSIAVAPSTSSANQNVYILNVVNSTVAVAPAAMLVANPQTTVSKSELAAYRNGVLDAFADLLGLILQDLKDCLCDRFLVNCPSCDGDAKLYLGNVKIHDSQVYRICNLDRRRYVKSFPTYGYWLSIIPILPLMKWLIETLCCAVIPDLFSKYQAGQTVGSKDRLQSGQLLNAKSYVQSINFSAIREAQYTKLATTGKLATDSLNSTIFNYKPVAFAQKAVQVDQSEVVGQQQQAVTERLAEANITVDAVQPYNPGAAANAASFLTAPTDLKAGSHVVLYQENGVVRYYSISPAPTLALSNLSAQVQQVQQAQQTVLTNFEQSQQTIAAQQATIASHEQEIAALKTNLSQMLQAQTARDRELADLKVQVQGILRQPKSGATGLS